MPWTVRDIKAIAPKVVRMGCSDLILWCKSKARPGDIAYWHDRPTDQHYFHIYNENNTNPMWKLWSKDDINRYIERVDKLTIEEPKMDNKRCDKCVYYKKYDSLPAFCQHDNHKGMIVPDFTSCSEYEPKKTGPFSNIKIFLKDSSTGELELKYVCEDCGKVMDMPYNWQFKFPARHPGQPTLNTCGFQFRCEECDKKGGVR